MPKPSRRVLDRVFDNIKRTGSPSSADLAFCLPDDVIAGLPQEHQNEAFLRKFRFLGYAMWKSTCYHQVREHAAFEKERTLLIERFPSLERRFREGVREGHSAAVPTVGPDTPPDIISSTVTGNGCTLFQLQGPRGIDTSMPSDQLSPEASMSGMQRHPWEANVEHRYKIEELIYWRARMEEVLLSGHGYVLDLLHAYSRVNAYRDELAPEEWFWCPDCGGRGGGDLVVRREPPPVLRCVQRDGDPSHVRAALPCPGRHPLRAPGSRCSAG